MADEYGLSETGLRIATFDEIKTSLENKLSEDLGGVDFELPSVFGVFSNIMSEEIAGLWEELQKLYNSCFIDTATGVSLDYVVASNLLSRLRPTFTKVVCQLSGANYTVIPQGTQVKIKNSDITFSLADDDLTLSNEFCYSALLSLKDVQEVDYTVTLDEVDYTYTATEADTELTILEALKELVDDSIIATTIIVANQIKITTTNIASPFSCFVNDNLQLNEVTNNANFTCDQSGKITAPSFSLVDIQNPIQGFNSVINATSGVVGRDLETDIELRARQRNSFSIAGSSTDPAIEARLLQVAGVTAVKVTSDRVQNTLSALVLGGEDIDVATTLQSTRPAGIPLIGNTEVIVTVEGVQYPILFTRPTKIWITVSVTITKNDNFKDTSADLIKTKILTYINSIGVANEVTYQALFGFIYSVSGVVNAIVNIGGSTDEGVTPTLSASNVAIQSGQMPISDESKVTIDVS